MLLAAAVLAVVALWALARLRFPERTAAQQVVAPILAPLVARQGFAGLESQLTDVSARIAPSLAVVALEAAGRHTAALRLHDDVAVALPGEAGASVPEDTISVAARDVSGLAVLRIGPGPAAPLTPSWFRRDPVAPRYVMQTIASAAGVSLVPVLVSGLVPVEAPLWAGTLWAASPADNLRPGAFLFTPDGEWIGLIVSLQGRPAIAPAELVSRLAEARLARAGAGRRHLGLEVQALTPALRGLLAFPSGVVVTWVAPDGPAHGLLQVGDVPHAADGRALPTLEHWRRHLDDLGMQPTMLKVWRDGQSIDVSVTPTTQAPSAPAPAAPAPAQAANRTAGLTTRLVPGVGVEVTAVQQNSQAMAADLRVGDIITRIGPTGKPTPPQVRAAVAARQSGGLLVAVTRGGAHHLTVLTP